MSSTWSYSDLKRQYGEEAALEMLQDMSGYGKFGRHFENPSTQPDPKDIDRCPLCGKALSSRGSCGQ